LLSALKLAEAAAGLSELVAPISALVALGLSVKVLHDKIQQLNDDPTRPATPQLIPSPAGTPNLDLSTPRPIRPVDPGSRLEGARTPEGAPRLRLDIMLDPALQLLLRDAETGGVSVNRSVGRD
jgi:hypothetical protein